MSIPVVYDTMLFLQAASRPDRTHATFRAIQEKQVTLFLSPDLLSEIQDVLNRDSVRAKFPALTPEVVKVFISALLAQCILLANVPRAFDWPEHPDDNHVFDLAIHANAKYLATWETRILNLSTDMSPPASLLRRLAPDLTIATPQQLADFLKPSNAP